MLSLSLKYLNQIISQPSHRTQGRPIRNVIDDIKEWTNMKHSGIESLREM